MEINRQIKILAILVAALFLVAGSWPSTVWAATKTSTETHAKAAKKKVDRNNKSANLVKPRIAKAQTTNVSGNTVPVAYPVCVPCVSGPVYTWNVPAAAGVNSAQSATWATKTQWPSGTNGAAQQGSSQPAQVPTTGVAAAGAVCPNVCASCWSAPVYSWNVPATAAVPPVTQSYLPPAPPPPPVPAAGFSAPAQPASTCPGPLQRLFAWLRNPCP